MKRRLLILLGAVIVLAATAFWVWVNGLAAAFSNRPFSLTLFTLEAVGFFWLPVALGAGLIFWGRRS